MTESYKSSLSTAELDILAKIQANSNQIQALRDNNDRLIEKLRELKNGQAQRTKV